MKKRKVKLSVFEETARLHESIANGLEKAAKQLSPQCKPAILREVAHHLDCAARMRQPLLKGKQ
jgi:hypothetical protein